MNKLLSLKKKLFFWSTFSLNLKELYDNLSLELNNLNRILLNIKRDIDIQKTLILDKDEFSSIFFISLKESFHHYSHRKKKIFNSILAKLSESDFSLEIFAGVGGQESSIFADELRERYISILNEMKVKFLIKDNTIYFDQTIFELFKYEEGVHRVQRIPATESQGRMHTSTVQVKLNGICKNAKIDLIPKYLKYEAMRSTGPGGQHVNTTSSAVRITHEPSKINVKIDNARDQIENKASAEMILKRKLEEFMNHEIFLFNLTLSKKFTSIDRSDKIRTYNFQTDRMVDHRAKIQTSILHFKDSKKFLNFIKEIRDRLA